MELIGRHDRVKGMPCLDDIFSRDRRDMDFMILHQHLFQRLKKKRYVFLWVL